jgi:hypothetical protein
MATPIGLLETYLKYKKLGINFPSYSFFDLGFNPTCAPSSGSVSNQNLDP